MQPLNVLMVEDRISDAELTLRELRKTGLDFASKLVKSEADFIKALGSPIDVIICDHKLLDFNSTSALHLLKEKNLDIPFIIVSGTISEELAVESMKLGADDYLLKDRLARLGQAVVRALEQKKLRDENRRAFDYAALLSEASAVLASSLDTTITIRGFTSLLMPKYSDFCDVRVLRDREERLDTAAAFIDPSTGQRHYGLAEDSDISHELLKDWSSVAKIQIPWMIRLTESGESELFPDWLKGSYFVALTRLKVKNIVYVPLVVRSEVIGIVVVGRGAGRSPFDDMDVNLLSDLGRRLAVSVDNARLFELAQEGLNQQLEAHRIKDEFLATISHELRTPLSAILGFSEMIRDSTVSDSELRRSIEVIYRNARIQSQLISDLLDVSRIVTGKMILNHSEVQLTNVILDVVDSLALAAESKSIIIDSSGIGRVRTINGDAARLHQIVWNLLSNAIKFSPKRGVVHLTLREVESMIEFAVCDEGKGIRPEFLPHLFERFRQEDASFTREVSGLGIGLAIVRQLVELHGGEVEAVSGGIGRGASFFVRFPIAPLKYLNEKHGPNEVDEDTEGINSKKQKLDKAILGIQPVLAAKEIMVIDDNEDSRMLVQILLERAGARVISLESARQALNLIKSTRPHAIICDISMPDMDGYSFIKELRSREKNALDHIPVAALTAFAGEDNKKRAIEYGFEEHISKPVEMKKLIETVCRLAGSANQVNHELTGMSLC